MRKRTVSTRFAWAVYAVLICAFAVRAGTEIGSFTAPLSAQLGGTGVDTSTAANGKLLIGNGSGLVLNNLTQGSANQVVITNGAGTITLATPQDIATSSDVTFNTATVKWKQSTKTTNYSVLAADTNTAFDNTGAAGSVNFTLPTAAAGLVYRFTAMAVQTVQATAGASTTIQVGGTTSASAGNITFNAKGASVTLYAVDSTHWVATDYTGTITVN